MLIVVRFCLTNFTVSDVLSACLSAAAAAAATEPHVEADDEEGWTANVDEASPVKAVASVELTSAPPGRLISPNKSLPTANGPTSKVVTRPRLSRTLDLSTSVCVEKTVAAAPEVKPAAEIRRLTPSADVTQSGAVTGNVRKLLTLSILFDVSALCIHRVQMNKKISAGFVN